MTALELTVPPTVQLLAAASLPGWRGTIDGNRARWRGGSLGPGKRKQFPVGLLASGAPGETSLSVSQCFADGRSVDWQVMLLVTPGAEAEPGRRSWWITVAAVAAVAVAGAVLVALLRPRRGESD